LLFYGSFDDSGNNSAFGRICKENSA
jgi:hypothetical protein